MSLARFLDLSVVASFFLLLLIGRVGPVGAECTKTSPSVSSSLSAGRELSSPTSIAAVVETKTTRRRNLQSVEQPPRQLHGHQRRHYHPSPHAAQFIQLNSTDGDGFNLYSMSSVNRDWQDQTTEYRTELTDVWLCMAMALGWMVWMLSSFVKSDLLRYQRESILVRGHVLQVSVEEDSLGTGIPTFHAVIDYMLEKEDSSIQVRKHFETQNLLEQGFANVELLVLPEEPTHSVLREDWQQQVEEQRQDGYTTTLRHLCKRLSIAFAGLLVLVSIGAATLAAERLDDTRRWLGWVSVCFGVTLLLPTAILIHRFLQFLQRVMDFDSEKAGIILRGAIPAKIGNPFECESLDVLDARAACDEEENMVNNSASPLPRRPYRNYNQDGSDEPSQNLLGDIVTESDIGCYFVKLPPRHGAKSGSSRKKKSDFGGGSTTDNLMSNCHRRGCVNSTSSLMDGADNEDANSNEDEARADLSVSTVSSLSIQDQSVLSSDGEHSKNKNSSNNRDRKSKRQKGDHGGSSGKN